MERRKQLQARPPHPSSDANSAGIIMKQLLKIQPSQPIQPSQAPLRTCSRILNAPRASGTSQSAVSGPRMTRRRRVLDRETSGGSSETEGWAGAGGGARADPCCT